MKKLMIGLVAMTSLVFGTGCGGGDYCEDLQDSFEGLDDKLDDCPELKDALEQALGNLEISDSDVEDCKEESEDCSDSEKERREKAVDCINDLDKCEEGDEQAWTEDFAECFEDIADSCG